MNPGNLLIISILLAAAAALLVGGSLLRRAWQLRKNEVLLDRSIAQQDEAAHPSTPKGEDRKTWLNRMIGAIAHWVDTPLGNQLVAEEDRLLLNQCGVNDVRGKTLFFISRLVFATGLPICGWIIAGDAKPVKFIAIIFFCFAFGYMAPKWMVKIKARERRTRVANEIPLFIDLLRLLQGVGLSIDQSLHIIENEFKTTLPILSKELHMAASQYMNGRTREQSLRRLSTTFDNDDLNSIARLIVQVDQYGGAIQQPLQQFSDRLREQHKLDMKEKVGTLTVKMTGVMVLTMLPALLIITGGAGFLAIIRTLSKIGT